MQPWLYPDGEFSPGEHKVCDHSWSPAFRRGNLNSSMVRRVTMALGTGTGWLVRKRWKNLFSLSCNG